MTAPCESRTYNERAAAADREYTERYAAAVASMPERKQAKLKEAGLDTPQAEEYRPVRRSDDEGESDTLHGVTHFDPASTDTLEDLLPEMFEPKAAPVAKLQELFDVDEETAAKILEWHRQGVIDAIRAGCRRVAAWHLNEMRTASEKLQAFLFQRVVAGFLRPGNVKLRAIGLAIAAKLDALNGLKSQAEAAKKVGVTPAAVSAVVNYWADTLGLPRNDFMKGEAARKSYSKARKDNHWRKQKCKKQPA